MNFEITQSLQRKLERRIERLKNVDGRFLPSAIKQFISFIESESALNGILEEIKSQFSLEELESFQTNYDFNYSSLANISDERELTRISTNCLIFLSNQSNFSRAPDLAFKLGMENANRETINKDSSVFLFHLLIQPFCDYFIERLNNQQMILSFIQCYKHRSEWFRQSELMKIYYEEMKKKESGEKKHAFVEDRLASDLYSYLFDEGINFYISPSSITGRPDLIEGERRLLEAQAGSTHRLLADAKVFDGKSRNASYIGKGFGQILSYCKRYNESFGYLIIYNISEEYYLEFELENTLNGNPIYKNNGKTIIFIVIDINKTKADSTLGKAKVKTVKKSDLLENID